MKLGVLLMVSGVGASLVLASQATAGVVSSTSDASFISYQNSGGFSKTFGGNVRWGNGANNGDWEYAIVDGSDTPVGAVANTTWSGTNAHQVTFSYDGSGSASLNLGGIGSVTRSVLTDPTVLFARVKDSARPFSSLSAIGIDLWYNGVGVDYTYSLLSGDSDAEYWGVNDANLRFGFTLVADAELAGPRSAGSDPMYQFKVGIPTPGSAALLGLGVAMMIGSRRR